MRAVVTVGVISLIAVAVMIHSAVADGFSILEAPLALMEVAFVGAVYLLWRALGGGEDLHQSHHTPPAPRRHVLPPPGQPSVRMPSRPAAHRGKRSRIATWADWWFNGLRDPHRH